MHFKMHARITLACRKLMYLTPPYIIISIHNGKLAGLGLRPNWLPV